MSKDQAPSSTAFSRRHFARLLAGGAAAALAPAGLGRARAAERPWLRLAQAAGRRDEASWQEVREQFVMPLDLAVLNAANLCPSSRSVLDTLYEATRDVVAAFQRHFRPARVDGIADPSTLLTLRALIETRPAPLA